VKLSLLPILDELKRIVQYIVIDLDNFRLPFAPINNFLKGKSGISINMLRDYSYGLINYFNWLNIHNLNYLNVTENQIRIYISFLEDEPDKRTNEYKLLQEYRNITKINTKMKGVETINKQIGVIRSFYDYLLKYSYVYHNPCLIELRGSFAKGNVGMLSHTHNKEGVVNLLRLKNNKSFDIDEYLNEEKIDPKEPFTADEVSLIMSLLKNPQERLLICMLFLGMRISEPLGRRISDIKWSQRIIQIIKRQDDPKDGKIKNDSERNVEMGSVLYFDNIIDIMKQSYDQYVNEVLRPCKNQNHRNYLFINIKGQPAPLSYSNIYGRIIRDNLQKNITSRKITFHNFRHHFSSSSIALGRPIEDVQKILGHKHISTTIQYYYNPSIRFLKTLIIEGLITEKEAKSRAKYILDYKKKFCK
jgi:site-specific recombinase XerD